MKHELVHETTKDIAVFNPAVGSLAPAVQPRKHQIGQIVLPIAVRVGDLYASKVLLLVPLNQL